ncbi:MAG: hypothetical protein E7062_07355 [Spirochaetaceae bacterium]|nr:hypothetical protein [Spirochaetaceae bacterium]
MKKILGILFIIFSCECVFSADLRNDFGLFTVILHEKTGSFTLYTQKSSSGKKVSLLDSLDNGQSTVFYVKKGNDVYPLKNRYGFSVVSRFTENGFVIDYIKKNDFSLTLEGVFFSSSLTNTPDTLQLTYTLTNNGISSNYFSLKTVWDTVLGELSMRHFSTKNRYAINGEMNLLNIDSEEYIISSDSYTSLAFLLSGADITTPQEIYIASKDALVSKKWVVDIKSGKGFNTLRTYNNSALAFLWSDMLLASAQSFSSRFYISASVNEGMPASLDAPYFAKKMYANNFVTELNSTVDVEENKDTVSETVAEQITTELIPLAQDEKLADEFTQNQLVIDSPKEIHPYENYTKDARVTYEGNEYVVICNTFLGDALSEDGIKNKYRKEFLNISEYIELYREFTHENGTLISETIYLNQDLLKLGRSNGIWDEVAYKKRFKDEISRESDFNRLNVYKFEKGLLQGRLDSDFNYFKDATKKRNKSYKKVDYNDILRTREYFDYYEIDAEARPLWVKETKATGEVVYSLLDKNSSQFTSLVLQDNLEIYDEKDIQFSLKTFGAGNLTDLLDESYFSNSITVKYYAETPLFVSENRKMERTRISTKESNYAGEVLFEKSLRVDDKGESWDEQNLETVTLSTLNTLTDSILPAEEMIEINEIHVPAFLTYQVHFEKNEDGAYGLFDKYTKITCYPEWDATVNRIVYKVTQKSLDDFVSAYKNDFETLYGEKRVTTDIDSKKESHIEKTESLFTSEEEAYINALIEQITLLENDVENIDREEIQRLNAELDRILEKVRK